MVSDRDSESKKDLISKNAQLELELESKEKEYEKKLRTMRQEQERIKAIYEERAGNSGDSKLVKDLENELEKTKSYYNKRIREIEDKYKYGMGRKQSNAGSEAAPKSHRSGQSAAEKKVEASNMAMVNELRDQNDRLLRDRNHLA